MLNSFSQACTTFVGQNYGAWKLDRCKKTMAASLLEDAIATAAVIALVLGAGKPVLAIFNNNPQVISLGYTRLVLVFSAYMFSMMYEVMSGYLRGFGISLTPAALTTLGVCGIRIFWIAVALPPQPHLSHDHVCLSHQPVHHRRSSSWPCCGSARPRRRRARG